MARTLLSIFRAVLGWLVAAYAAWLFLESLPAVNIVGPLFLGALGLWLIIQTRSGRAPLQVSARLVQRARLYRAGGAVLLMIGVVVAGLAGAWTTPQDAVWMFVIVLACGAFGSVCLGYSQWLFVSGANSDDRS